MYLIGPPDGAVLCYMLRLEIYGTTFVSNVAIKNRKSLLFSLRDKKSLTLIRNLTKIFIKLLKKLFILFLFLNFRNIYIYLVIWKLCKSLQNLNSVTSRLAKTNFKFFLKLFQNFSKIFTIFSQNFRHVPKICTILKSFHLNAPKFPRIPVAFLQDKFF